MYLESKTINQENIQKNCAEAVSSYPKNRWNTTKLRLFGMSKNGEFQEFFLFLSRDIRTNLVTLHPLEPRNLTNFGG